MVQYIPHGIANSTPDESWCRVPSLCDWYDGAGLYALEVLGSSKGDCLVIGSPIFEAMEIQRAGWDVTFLDVRNPGHVPFKFVQGDAAELPLKSKSFDGVSSTCVLCHVGLGRYGDRLMEDGDRWALWEMYRVMKHGAVAAVMFGPAFPGLPTTLIVGTTHRIYKQSEAVQLAREVGFKTSDERLWNSGRWLKEEDLEDKKLVVDHVQKDIPYSYLSMTLEKP